MPAPFATTKVCTQTTELPDHEGRLVRIEEGTSIQIPVYSIHHDPEFWTNPDEFIPERFDEQNGGAKAFNDQGIYFPFGNGPRRCLGKFQLFELLPIFNIIQRHFQECGSLTQL